ncbi:MAG: iron-containing alcohol dehydrogenase [Planctomycetia bacterium]|nr:iron-containing alcohol dehydrogenase [Planctomycetia bacterium]
MQNFVFQNPTKIIFGRDTISQIGQESRKYGASALLVYGQNSVKKNGILQTVCETLRENGVSFVEHSGVKPNPVLSHAEEGIRKAKDNKVEMIIAIGGGSVIDEAKAIAAGSKVDYSVWDFYCRKKTVQQALPVLTVLTLAATGTEMNGRTVLTNEETQEKFVIGADPFYPKISILDPTTTFTVSREQTAYGAIDAASHLMEVYFTHSDDWFTPIQDRYSEGIIRSLIDASYCCLEKADDYNARATIMWGASLAWNGLAPSGVGRWFTPNHLIGMGMSALFDSPHGATISVSFSHWLSWFMKQSPENKARVEQFGREVFLLKESEFLAERTIEALKNWYSKLGSPIAPNELGLDYAKMKLVAKKIESFAHFWMLPHYHSDFVLSLFYEKEFIRNQ